ncbi:MAG: response regulator [Spirochaetales bacterium]|nr:response regulator [Spirochaetales bacterium]
MKYRILVAEDEQLERVALVRIVSALEGYDIEVVEAVNGRQAVEQATRGRIDIALLDIRMPGMDGMRAAHELRTLWPPIRIVFVTAFDQFDYAREALRLGVDEYLVKPASPDEVRDTIERILSDKEGEYSSASPGQTEDRSVDEAMAMLEDELRKDLFDDTLDGDRLLSFFRLRGAQGARVLALAMRVDVRAGSDGSGAVDTRAFLGACVNQLESAGWIVVAGSSGKDARCAAAERIAPSGSVPEPLVDIKPLLDHIAALAGHLHRVSVRIGARLSPGGLDSTPIGSARKALALTSIDTPVVMLLPDDTHDTGTLYGGRSSVTVDRALRYMMEHLAENVSLVDVAGAVGCAPSHLSRLFGKNGGDTFVHVLCKLRTDAARELLKTGQYRIKEVCALVGFRDQAYFSRVYRKYEGTSPRDDLGSGA